MELTQVGLKKVREFAAECGCTPQNIYGHLRTYAEDLEGHTFQGKGRTGVFLDEYAQEFLRSVMYPKELSTDATVAKLQEEVAELRSALFQAMQKDMELSSKLATTEGERDRLQYDVKQYKKQLLLAETTDAEKTAKLETATRELEEAKDFIECQERHLESGEEARRQLMEELEAEKQQNQMLRNRNWFDRLIRKGE